MKLREKSSFDRKKFLSPPEKNCEISAYKPYIKIHICSCSCQQDTAICFGFFSLFLHYPCFNEGKIKFHLVINSQMRAYHLLIC